MNIPNFSFFISGEKKKILPDSKLWNTPLSGRILELSCQPDGSGNEWPGNEESDNSGTTNQNIPKKEISIGDYFKAAETFLTGQDCSPITKGLESRLKYPVQQSHIKDIKIFLEKHGAFYHPMKVLVSLNSSDSCSFVLNGAVSERGLALIESEYQLISELNAAFVRHYLPQVYAMGFIEISETKTAFFLGEWFEGYKEFHITRDRGKREIALWKGDGTCQYISEKQALSIYKEIARILTFYYNIETFEHIFPWHHAAGDFIVKESKDELEVRLITTRGYQALTEFAQNEKSEKNYILPSLLIFFMKLSFKIRIDRFNGVGNYTLLNDEVIKSAADGFLNALDEKSAKYNYGNLKKQFAGFFRRFDLEQLTALSSRLISEAQEHTDTEKQLISQNSDSHCRILHSIFKDI